MRHSKDNNTSALGLDVGTSRVCLAQRVGEEFQYETQLNAFVTIPYSKMTENVLRKEKVPHTVNGAEMVVHGNESDRFADLLNIETRRTMDRGVLNPAEPDSLSMLRKIIETLVDPTKEKQKLCFTVPAAPLGAEENLTYHEATLRQILSEFGYEVKSINEGLAVIYSELESTNYTGIGISCGGGLCNVSVAYLSVPVFSFSIPKAGDYIDTNTASVTGERANRVRIAKEESFHFNGFFADKMHQVLGVYYEEMIQALVNGMKQAFTNARNIPKSGRALQMEQLDLNELARATTSRWVPRALAAQIDLGFEPSPRALSLVGDRLLLEELLGNLLDNAIRYTPQGGEVTVRVSELNKTPVLSVEDTGPGIPEDERALVLERFHRGRNAAQTPGSGLGLSIVREIAQTHGARVDIDSGPGGRGSAISVLFAPG